MNRLFAVDYIEPRPNYLGFGSADFGKPVRINIPRNGDFVRNCYLNVELPSLDDTNRIMRNKRKLEAVVFFLGWLKSPETCTLTMLNYDCIMHICNNLVDC